MKSFSLVILLLLSHWAYAQTAGVCPNYILDGNTGEAYCRVDVRSGETIFYWDADRNGFAEKTKHIFDFVTADRRRVQFATFAVYDPRGRLISQSWTNTNLDDWLYSAKDTNGDGFFETFCQYQVGGSCAPISCQIATVKAHHDQMYQFYVSATDPLTKSYGLELYSRSDKLYNYCRYIESQRGPVDERTNIRP